MPACAPCLAAVLVVAGLVLVGGGLGAKFGIPEAAKSQLKASLSVDSRDHEKFKDKYESPLKAEQEGGGVFLSYTVFNLTNPAEFLAGEKPVFKAVGPFTYVRRQYFKNVKFVEGGNQAKYEMVEEQVFQPDRSEVKRDDEVNIIQANVFYMSAVLKAKGETRLLLSITAGTFKAMQRAFGLNMTVQGLKTLRRHLEESGNGGDFNATQYPAVGADFSNATLLGLFLSKMKALNAGDTSQAVKLSQAFPKWGVGPTEWGTKGARLVQYYTYASTAIKGGLVRQFGHSGSLALQKVSGKGAIFEPNAFLKKLDSNSTTSLFSNDSALNAYTTWTGFTGKDRLADMNGGRFTEVEGLTRADKYPKKMDLNVRLTTTDSYQDEMEEVAHFYYPLMERELPAKKVSDDAKVKDVPTTKYRADRAALTKPNADYANKFQGLINIAPVKKSAPFYLSPPFNDEVPAAWTKNISGVSAPAGYDTQSYLYIEKTTGLGILVDLRIQVNYLVPVANFTDLKERSGYLLYPLAVLNQHGTVSDDGAKDLRKATVGATALANGLGFGLIGLGVVLLVIGLLLCVCFCCCGCCAAGGSKEE